MNSKIKKYLTIISLGLAGGSVYLLPYIKYILYDAHLASMNITNTQSGYLMTMYTIGNIILYIPGGVLADKIPARKALFYSCLSTSALAFIYAFTLENFMISMLIWLGLSIGTGFVFWSALLKTVRMIGTEEEQGFLYGLYYACNGVASAIVNGAAVWIYQTGADMQGGYFRVCILGAIVPIITGFILLFLLKDEEGEPTVNNNEPKFRGSDLKLLVKNPIVWIISFIMFCGYGFYSSTSYFTPYLTDVFKVSIVGSGFLSTVRTYLLLLLAPIGGLIADKLFKSTSKWLYISFSSLAILFGVVLLIPSTANVAIVSFYTLIPSVMVMMTYGVISSIVSEIGIPKSMTGTMIGLISIIGYLPDAIYSLMFGNWLDKYSSHGYNYIFGYLALSGIMAAILSFIVYKYGKKMSNEII